MIILMYISSTFLTLALYYSESILSVVFSQFAFISALVADHLWRKAQSKIKSLEKALAERKEKENK